MILGQAALMVAVLTLSACSKKSSEEACGGEVVDSYNAVVTNLKNFKKSGEKRDLVKAVKSCQSFQINVGGGSCKAVDTATGQEVQLSAASMECSKAQAALDILNGKNPSQPQQYPEPYPQQPGRSSGGHDSYSYVTIVVRNAKAINEMLSSQTTVFSRGQLMEASSASPEDVVCYMLSTDPSLKFRKHDLIYIEQVAKNDGLKLTSSDGRITIRCTTSNNNGRTTFSDLREAFGRTIEISGVL